MGFDDGLSKAERERLAILAEESNEVAAVCMKALRHGYESRDPTTEGSETNRQMIERELGHLQNIVEMMMLARDLSSASVAAGRDHKASTIGKWLHHQ